MLPVIDTVTSAHPLGLTEMEWLTAHAGTDDDTRCRLQVDEDCASMARLQHSRSPPLRRTDYLYP